MMWTSNFYRGVLRCYFNLMESALYLTEGKTTNDSYGPFKAVDLQSIFNSLGATDIEIDLEAPEVQMLWKHYIWPVYYTRSITYQDIDMNTEGLASPDFSPEVDKDKMKVWWGAFYNTLLSTSRQYIPIIKVYESEEQNLLNKLTSTTTVTNEGEFNNSGSSTQTGTQSGTSSTNSNSTTNDHMNDVPTNYGSYSGQDFNTTLSGSTITTNDSSESGSTSNNSSTQTASGTNNSTTTTNVDNSNLVPIVDRLQGIRDKWEDLYRAWADSFIKLFNLSA